MEQRMKDALDRYITGNYGEDQFRGICKNCKDCNEDRDCFCHIG